MEHYDYIVKCVNWLTEPNFLCLKVTILSDTWIKYSMNVKFSNLHKCFIFLSLEHYIIIDLSFRVLKLILNRFKMVREDKSAWKAGYFEKLATLLEEYPKCFIVGADNVGSKQMQVTSLTSLKRLLEIFDSFDYIIRYLPSERILNLPGSPPLLSISVLS